MRFKTTIAIPKSNSSPAVLADSDLVGKRAKRCAELSMAAHASLRELAEGYSRSCEVFRCRALGETGSRLVALLVDAFESPKISAELAFYGRHDLAGKWMALNSFCRFFKGFEVINKKNVG